MKDFFTSWTVTLQSILWWTAFMNCFKVHLQVPCNFEFSITCIALKLLCPFMNGGFMSYHLSILQTASATKIPPQILQIHVLLMASVAAQLILAIFIATSFCLFFDYLELKIMVKTTHSSVQSIHNSQCRKVPRGYARLAK